VTFTKKLKLNNDLTYALPKSCIFMLWLLVTKDKRLISIFITATCYLEIEYKSIYLNAM